MALEVERKFLLPAAPDWLGDHSAQEIEQGYLAIAGDVEVRLRRSDGERLLTVKRGHGEVREEVEVPLTEDQFERLWPLTEPLRIEKRRYVVPLGGELRAEVDVYRGELDGLILAEVEFSSEAAAEAFDLPDWLGREVTGDERYANQTLAQSGGPKR
jgi:adenylate cyclase